MNRNIEDIYTDSAAVDDIHFIKSRVCVSGVHDGQRSSLMIQLQSVSESLCAFITLNICTGIIEISIDLSDVIAIKIPFNIFLLVCLYTSV